MKNVEIHRPENFAPNLKNALDFLGWTQLELAEKSGLTQAAVSQIVNGQRLPCLKTVCQIMNVLPVKFERLVK